MKVLHIGIASHFTDKMLYQDNILSDLNSKAGHEVTFISDNYMYKDGMLVETEECDTLLENGVRLIRIKYDRVINDFVTIKIQKARKIRQYLNEIKPDTILYHGVCGYELMDVAEYVKKEGIPFYVDSHENFKNTARTPIAKFSYKYIHGFFVKRAIPAVNKVLFIGYPEKYYLKEMYHFPEDILEYFPLGGNIIDKEKQALCRNELIKKLGFPEDVIICAHSGKMDKGKKTKDVLEAFANVKDERLRLLIFGSIHDEMKEILLPLIEKDKRVYFLGWQTGPEQESILGATDLYLQPGTYSATAQTALCAGCALVVNNDYREAMGAEVFYAEDRIGLEQIILKISSDSEALQKAKEKAFVLANNQLDYKKLAERYLY